MNTAKIHPIINSKVDITPLQDKLPVLATERLILKAIQVEDISDEYIAWLNNPKITENLELRFTPQSREAVVAFIESKLADIVSGWHFGVFDQQGKRLVGNVSLNRINPHHNVVPVDDR